ncbi:MAG: transposase, partial [Hyphomicrobiales bacterium]|nr:transposase [Hyphomicrobiales bacterium]
LALADGVSIRATARAVGSHQDTVAQWRDRFVETGVEGIGVIAPGRGRKPATGHDVIEAIVCDRLHSVPDDGSTCWSTRSLAAVHGVGKDTVAKIWKARNVGPWRTDTFKLSNDPDFETKLVDVVGLYLDPPERAVVFSFDEKTQVQALDRTQRSLPLKDDLDIHVVLDNFSAHKSTPVRDWLAHPKRARWHLHFTPTSASWLNLIERCFSVLTTKALRDASFSSVTDVEVAINRWATGWNG